MWLFIWKKYEFSWIATAVSFVGNILAVFAGIGAGILVGGLAGGGTVGSILALVVGIAVHVALRVALNRLTDIIANRQLNGSVDRYARKLKKSEADGKVRDARLMEIMANETNQDKLLKAVRESMEIKVGRTSEITFEQSMEGAKRLDEAHLLDLIAWRSRFSCPRVVQKQSLKAGEPLNIPAQRMVQLIELLPSAEQREEQMKYYYLK